MANFVIYTFEFGKLRNTREPELFPDETNVEENFSNKQEILSKILEDERDLGFSYEDENLNYLQVLHYLNLVILRIANHKIKKGELNFSEVEFDSYPSSMVIIDNRKDIQHIAIQKRTEAFKNTDVLANIIKDTLNRHLYSYGLTIDINHKTFVSGFWNIAERLNYQIDKMEINFPPVNLPRITNLIKGIANQSEMLNGRAKTSFEAANKTNLVLEKSNPFLEQILEACSDAGYDVLLRSSVSKTVYSIRDETPAVTEYMSDELLLRIQAYKKGSEDMFNTLFELLVEWVNNIQTVYF